MSERTPDELQIATLLRDRPAEGLPPCLASGRLWREIQARRRPRSVPVLSRCALDVVAAMETALAPALAGLRR